MGFLVGIVFYFVANLKWAAKENILSLLTPKSLEGVGGRVDQRILVVYPIVLVSQWSFVDPTIPRGLGRRQHKQNAIIACILSREKILDIAFEAPFSFIDITMVICVYTRL